MPSIETQKKMHAFFMKTSAPRLYKKQLEKEREEHNAVEDGECCNEKAQ